MEIDKLTENNQSINKQLVETNAKLKLLKDENNKLKNLKGHLSKDLAK
jgi:FtsZ-binding cell division protein ZapB